MDQNNVSNSKKLPTALTSEALRQVKGGYREMPGVAAGVVSVRWDEIGLRVDNDGDTSAMPIPTNQPNSPSLGLSIRKRP